MIGMPRLVCILLATLVVLPALAVQLTSRESGRIAEMVVQVLASKHLSQEAFNNRLSRMTFDNYLEALDGNRRIFLEADIDEFRELYETRLDDMLFRRNARAAFHIFDRYLERFSERVERNIGILAGDHDFTLDEDIELDRSERPWPATREEADEIWRKRIKANLLQERLDLESEEGEEVDLIALFEKRYQRLLHSMEDLEPDEILQIFLTALGRSYDPHSNYMCPSEVEDFEINTIRLQLTGIGARLQSDVDGYCKIVEIIPGGPASRNTEIHPDDLITAVAQGDGEWVDVVGMRLRKVVDQIRGNRGTEVRLRLIKDKGAQIREVSLIRDVIEIKERQATARIVAGEDGRRLGIIDLPQFYENSASHVRKILLRFEEEEVEGIVLDLRQNGGGILDEAVALTGLFLSEGPIVQVRDFRGRIHSLEDPDQDTVHDGPLLVLVSRHSASASEITTAALQDYGRALVVGDRATHGKGTVQTLEDLDRLRRILLRGNPAIAANEKCGMLKYTISNFYRVTGKPTQKYGVTPDIVLPSVANHRDDIGEEHLPNCLEAKEIAPSEHRVYGRVAPHREDLERLSLARRESNRDFAHIREDIRRYLELKERQLLSLNLQERLDEIEESRKRQEERKAERDERPLPDETVWLLTVDALAGEGALELLPHLTYEKPVRADARPEPRRPDPHLRESLNILDDYIEALQQPAAGADPS